MPKNVSTRYVEHIQNTSPTKAAFSFCKSERFISPGSYILFNVVHHRISSMMCRTSWVKDQLQWASGPKPTLSTKTLLLQDCTESRVCLKLPRFTVMFPLLLGKAMKYFCVDSRIFLIACSKKLKLLVRAHISQNRQEQHQNLIWEFGL